jgi:SOS-response transcriptional repressor LexA
MAPTLEPGDTVLVDRDASGPILDGSIYALALGGERVALRRAAWTDSGELRFSGDNPETEPILVDPDERGSSWHLLGRALHVVKPL